ncbi:MAG TPA: hypothetical protein VFY13_09060 [Luteolibacter sp.]|nr:hypothetical protein [Luteolibacter sp.]
MKELLEIGLKIGGISLILLCVASLWIPRALRWKHKLGGLTPLMRELWWTYSIYVWSSHLFFAVLALGFGDWLMGGSGAAIAMLVFMSLWWGVRLWLQFFGFDLTEVEPTPFNRLAKHLLALLFIGLVVLYVLLICWNLGCFPQGGPE